ncbi:MAG: cytidine deaminase [Sphingobium sp.]|nr:cytidine deaminase [Sphingobium sp.]
MTELAAQEQELVDAARAAMSHAYAPYSRFAVGAALRMTDGSVLTGSNFENASYGLSLCAETVAIAAANAQGRLAEIAMIAVAGAPMGGAGDAVVTPCGRCRQVLNEAQDVAGREIPILCVSGDGKSIARHRLADLLPHAFGPANLG